MFDGLTPLTFARLVLVLAGGGLFLYGISIDSPSVRWVAMGLLGVSFLLRFARRPR
ncbi:MAG TPA: hypothetical protein VFG84_06260 [Gemmatimonadaceae bacterium]|nr:hypothetical protein [Gemmatimonadaceae bacterium]